MKPISCTISGFRAFGTERTINFNDGLTAIVGPNKSGKSSTFLAIMWALYGPAALRDIGITQGDCVHEGFDRCRASLEFETGGLRHRVDREYLASGTTKLNLAVTHFGDPTDEPASGHDLTGATVRETQAIIDSLVGEYSVAAQSWYCGQDADKSFMFAPPSERMEVFSALLPTRTDWDALHGLAQDSRRDAGEDAQRLTLQIENLKIQLGGDTVDWPEWHDNHRGPLLPFENAEKAAGAALTTARTALTEAEAELTRLQAEAEAQAEKAKEYEAAGEKRKAAEELVTALSQSHTSQKMIYMRAQAVIARKPEIEAARADQAEKLRLFDEALAAYDALAKEIEQYRLMRQISLAASVLQQEHEKVDTRRNEILTEIENLEKSDACPTCGRVYDETTDSHITEAIKAKQEEELRIGTEWTAYEIKTTGTIDSLKADRVVTIELNMDQPEPPQQPRPLQPEQATALSGDLIALDDAEKNIDGLESQHAANRTALEEAQAALDLVPVQESLGEPKAILTPQGLAAVAEVKRCATEAVESAVTAHARATERLETARKAVTTLAETETALSAAHERLNDYELLVRATGPRGVRQLAVSQSLAGINSTVNRVLEVVDPGTTLYLDTQREAGDGSQAETLEATIVGPDGVATFGTRSGAEKSRIALAVRIALEVARAQSLGSESNATMILDEAFSSQDSLGKANYVQLFRWLTDTLGVNILLVTHDSELREMFDQVIEVEKIDGEAVVK